MPALSHESRRLRRLLLASWGLPALVLAALTVVLGLQVARLLELTRWVDHTDVVISSAHELERRLVDGETGVRGFVAYRDPRFLEPYARGEAALADDLATLERLVAGSPDQLARVGEIRRDLAAWKAYAARALDAARAGAPDPAPLEGKAHMDALREHVRTLVDDEEGERDARAAAVRAQTLGWIVTAVALATAATVALSVAARRAVRSTVGRYEAVLSARDEFLGIAAHELKTPLTAVHLELDRLSRAAATAAPRLREPAERALRGTERLATLVQQVLEVPRLVTDPDLAAEPVDLSEVARDAIRRSQRAARAAGVTVTLECEPVVGRWDRSRLDLAVSSLVSNAVKFGRAAPVRVRVSAEGATARLEVRDHGGGIDPADLARMFQKFERGVPVRHFGGLGLGLWLTRRVAEIHGGSVHVDSVPGEGSTFTLELPLAAEAAAPAGDGARRPARA